MPRYQSQVPNYQQDYVMGLPNKLLECDKSAALSQYAIGHPAQTLNIFNLDGDFVGYDEN
jgi:hypothetical protein